MDDIDLCTEGNHNCDGEDTIADNDPYEVVTLGSLYSKDISNAYFLHERPSSFLKDAGFLNDKKYIHHDNPPWPAHYTEYMKPMQTIIGAGNELPTLLRHKPKPEILEHWRKWLPFFPQPDLRDLTTEDTGDRKLITLFPLQFYPKEKHAYDPDMHYKILSKNCIPDMGATSPHHMTIDDYTVPCFIKVSHCHSGNGTFKANTREKAEKLIKYIRDEVRCPDPSISEVVDDVTGNYCVQFYLHKNGTIRWLGVTIQNITENFDYNGNYCNWNEQMALKKKLYSSVMPVKEYLHKKGYFGIVGIDVLTSKSGKYVIDVNPRINGSTKLVLMAPHLAARGFPTSTMVPIPNIRGNEIEMMRMFDKINSLGEGLVINLTSSEAPDGKTCVGHVAMFARDEDGIINLRNHILNDQE